MKARYRTEAEFLADFHREHAANRAIAEAMAPHPVARPAASGLQQKVIQRGTLRYSKPQRITTVKT